MDMTDCSPFNCDMKLSNADEVLLVLLSNANDDTAADGVDDGMDIDPPKEEEGPKRREEDDEDNALRDTS